MGQARKRRYCPALAREISAADCGENRLSRCTCPESCEFNPFRLSAYSQLLEMEDRLDLVIFKRIGDEDETARRAILAAAKDKLELDTHAVTIWQMFFRRDASGRTFAERWEQAGFPGLRNDERVFFRGKMKMRIGLIEVRQVLDAERVEAIDLLQPGLAPFTIVDRSHAAKAPRFYTALAWIYPLPHFWRFSGAAVDFGDLPRNAFDILEACISHLGGPVDPAERQRWLAENFPRVSKALMAAQQERTRLMFAGMDGAWGAATYRMQSPLKALARLRDEPEVAAEDPSAEEREKGFSQTFVWFEEHQAGQTAVPGRTVLGRILIGAQEWRLEAMGRARLQNLRARFESLVGSEATFSRERIDDLTARLAPSGATPNLELVPPQLLEQPNKLILSSSRIVAPPTDMPLSESAAWLHREHLRTWPDESVPALDGLTPREAARSPTVRPRLIELVKKQVRRIDEENLRLGRRDDANALIRELGLVEIDFPPPPVRTPPEAENDHVLPVAGKAGQPDEAKNRPPAPRLIGPPLTAEEAIDRAQAAVQQFPQMEDGLRELVMSGTNIVADLTHMIEGMIEPDEMSFIVASLLQAWFSLVPSGVRAPQLDLDTIADEIDGHNGQIAGGGEAAAKLLVEMARTGRQPGLTTVILANFLIGMDRLPKKMRVSVDARIAAMVVLKAVIDELDRALRR